MRYQIDHDLHIHTCLSRFHPIQKPDQGPGDNYAEKDVGVGVAALFGAENAAQIISGLSQKKKLT